MKLMQQLRAVIRLTWSFAFGVFIFAHVAIADDTTQASIVIPADSDPLTQYAAAELQRYVKTLFKIDASVSDTPTSADFIFGLGITKEGLSDQGLLLKPDRNTL